MSVLAVAEPAGEAARAATSTRRAGVVPIVRRAVMAKLRPIPSEEMADEVLVHLEAAWKEGGRDEFQLALAKAASIEPDDLEYAAESPRRRRDGKTPMIDFPGISTKPGGAVSFAVRPCIAVCADELSSKIWSRVGPRAIEVDGQGPIEVDNLRETLSFFRRIARPVADWATEWLRMVLRATFPEHRLTRRGKLEVVTLGARDERLRDVFRRLAADEVAPKGLLREPGSQRLLSRYFDAVFEDMKLLEVVRDPESFWFSYPTTVELEDGALEPRTMIFLMRESPDAAQVVGLGFDDSKRGELARRSGVRVSRWIANRG